MTVLTRVEAGGHMNPHVAKAIILEAHLINIGQGLQKAEVGTAGLVVGQEDVDGFARQMLTAAQAVVADVDGLGAEGAQNLDGTEVAVQGFQQFAAHVLHSCQLDAVRGVVHVVCFGPGRVCHHVVAEVRGQLKVWSFHKFNSR